jgi:hypothetical protein
MDMNLLPSRLFIYYNERKLEDRISTDSCASLGDGILTLKTIGVCPESEWKYDISKFVVKPDNECYKIAKVHKINLFYAIKQDLTQLKARLIQGFPFIFGFVIYSNFETNKIKSTGIMDIPLKVIQLLGHAVADVGFDDKK